MEAKHVNEFRPDDVLWEKFSKGLLRNLDTPLKNTNKRKVYIYNNMFFVKKDFNFGFRMTLNGLGLPSTRDYSRASASCAETPPVSPVQTSATPVQIPSTPELTTPQPSVQIPYPPVQLFLLDPPVQLLPVVKTLEPTLTDDSSIDQIMSSVFGDCSQQGILAPRLIPKNPLVLDTVPSLSGESNALILFLDHFEIVLAKVQQETPMDLTMPRLKKKVRRVTGFKVIKPLDLSVDKYCLSCM
ncbi:hypothetical protein TNCV_1519681 [Trichonephila clavipes]|nr:hypothetical protein TNCV_1519681 [Trichonephila clavipes]